MEGILIIEWCLMVYFYILILYVSGKIGQSPILLIVCLGPLKKKLIDFHTSSCRFFKKA